jgi:hypothetical protein
VAALITRHTLAWEEFRLGVGALTWRNAAPRGATTGWTLLASIGCSGGSPHCLIRRRIAPDHRARAGIRLLPAQAACFMNAGNRLIESWE